MADARMNTVAARAQRRSPREATRKRRGAERAAAAPGLSHHPRPQQACARIGTGSVATRTASPPRAAEEGAPRQGGRLRAADRQRGCPQGG
ncbi:hypothetical protein MRX96_006840 [Rhipicephalus microplus]